MAGRGWGKNRTGSEWINDRVLSGDYRRIALVAPTAADARDVMVEGESGILACAPSYNRPKYEPSKRRLTWPNGAMATTYSADEPDRLRGPQHDLAWGDELAAWRYPEAWDMLMFGLRIGTDPRALVTTTPRPIKVLKEILALPSTIAVRGSTYENRDNLAPAFFEKIVSKYEGTRLGRQELHAEILDDVPGALWSRENIELLKVVERPDLERIVVAVDPAVTANEESNETGVIIAGRGADGQGYVLDDLSCRLSPDGWAQLVVGAYRTWMADRVVAEVNNGGDLVESVLRTVDNSVSYRAVHASRGKRTRAEPIAALYEQSRIHHVGSFPELEDQMCSFLPEEKSPDRVDALVWAMTELAIENEYEESAVSGSGWSPYSETF